MQIAAVASSRDAEASRRKGTGWEVLGETD